MVRVNFAFLDGHVEGLKQIELFEPFEGRSTYKAIWGISDQKIENAQLSDP